MITYGKLNANPSTTTIDFTNFGHIDPIISQEEYMLFRTYITIIRCIYLRVGPLRHLRTSHIYRASTYEKCTYKYEVSTIC